jgi:LPXTG-motif cell wall-anchored protein
VTSVRRAFAVVFTGALLVVVWASTAGAQTGDYPPPTPTAGPGQAARVPGAEGDLAFTGSSNTPTLLIIGIAALVVGLVLVLAVRRRRAAVQGSV